MAVNIFHRSTSLIRNRHPPQDHHRAPAINLLQATRVGRFLMSKVPLYVPYLLGSGDPEYSPIPDAQCPESVYFRNATVRGRAWHELLDALVPTLGVNV